MATYRGRLAPSPTGYLHLGHARTFWIAQDRARRRDGVLVLRNEDLDVSRVRPHFITAMIEDLRWAGFSWQEGPDCGGPFAPYHQSGRISLYAAAFEQLRARGFLYPCGCSRRDVLGALEAPHAGNEEPVYPGLCRPENNGGRFRVQPAPFPEGRRLGAGGQRLNWRFRVPDGEVVSFEDGFFGPQNWVAGRDFGDFVVWSGDDLPSYQLAVVADDHDMGITEVVRGADLLLSTARQLLLYRALGWAPPAFYHCPLVTDDNGARLAKRHDALSLRALRARGENPLHLQRKWMAHC